jgi:ABC-type methionine transport system ATPase subunit
MRGEKSVKIDKKIEVTIILCTHELEMLKNLCDMAELWVMHEKGKDQAFILGKPISEIQSQEGCFATLLKDI